MIPGIVPLQLKKKSEMIVDNFTKPQLVTISVGVLGGHMDFVDREDVAEHVNGLAPGRFTWKKYRDRIDLEAVGNALRHAKKPVNGALVTGNTTAGWMLTINGIKWINSIDLQAITNSDFSVDSLTAIHESEIVRLRNTRAYKLYEDNKSAEININDFYQFARINEYFQEKSRQRRFTVIENAVAYDSKLSDLWMFLKGKFIEEVE